MCEETEGDSWGDDACSSDATFEPTFPRARKRHRCAGGGTHYILPKQTYVRYSGVSLTTVTHHRTCRKRTVIIKCARCHLPH